MKTRTTTPGTGGRVVFSLVTALALALPAAAQPSTQGQGKAEEAPKARKAPAKKAHAKKAHAKKQAQAQRAATKKTAAKQPAAGEAHTGRRKAGPSKAGPSKDSKAAPAPGAPAATSHLKPMEPPPAGQPSPASRKPAAGEQTGKPSAACVLLTREAPRGGRLEVKGEHFGQAALVRIGGQVTRIIERTKDTIAVQIPRKSDGGKVTVQAGSRTLPCGNLKIIGLN